ncbi:helix-turn-helix transcriptional regulator [Lachnospiraceae bacterium MD1]|jgi:AraC-like DNA-binding protein|uniref:Helix-turn-helix transcriptional regulator n=1 Tax=Variimorphobacter saccharofermentans TaxID=2755051 RepID=A0A839K2F7_9FIRM|nr:AraC family transcriptional regulator [Variimorphobacter saccharofermentans]MBB2183382.1 helix-turn-helix transcriptional regulator [Variimorphobacter saccharofermentans]
MNHIRYVEYDATHSGDFIFDVPEGHDCWLLLLTKTPAIFLVENELKEFPSNCAVLYKPHQKIYYRASTDSYINDWIRFDTDETYVTNSPITSGEPFPILDPAYCHRLYQLLVSEHILNNDYKDISIDYLLRILFNKLLESYHYKQVSPLYKNLNNLKKEIYRHPNLEWSVSKMAEMLNVSVGYLEDIYKNAFGVSCMEDVINSRINLAKKHLLYNHYSIAEIATLCGYRNMEHFFRQFKKNTGVTPNQFRRSPNH